MSDWMDTLLVLVDLASPIARIIQSKDDLTLENAWEHESVKELRDKLTEHINKQDNVDKLIEASEKMLKAQEEILNKEDISIEDLINMGVLSSTAYVLSSSSLLISLEPKQIFIYTMKEIYPWVEKAIPILLKVLVFFI
jgi:hypothetical protein